MSNFNFNKYVGLSDMAPDLPDFVRASGNTLIDKDSNEYLDLCSGRGTLPLGHNNQVVHDMTLWQMKSSPHLPSYGLNDRSPVTQFAMSLALHFDGFPQEKKEGQRVGNQVIFTEPGIAPLDFAITAAKDYNHKTGVAFLRGSSHADDSGVFHSEEGSASLEVAGDVTWIDPFVTMTERELDKHDWSEISAVVVELVQVNGGVRRIPDTFLKALRERCRKEKDILIIVDESRTGFGRTGRMFAQQTYGFTADITVLGGALGGGFPLGAVVANQKVMESISPKGLTTSVFGGHAVSCTAGLITMAQITEGRLENARKVARQLHDGLDTLVREFPDILKEVTSEGLMIALSFAEGVSPADFEALAQKHGVLLCFDWPYAHGVTIKAYPALTLTEEEAQRAITSIWSALNEMRGGSANNN